jgi:hypothetical protein
MMGRLSVALFILTRRQGLNSLLKNSRFDFVLKGRGFKPRRKCHKINSALAAGNFLGG